MFFVRMLKWALVVSAVVLIAATLVGRAYDKEAEQHVVFTKHGRTLDCNRAEGADGRVFYDHCVYVP